MSKLVKVKLHGVLGSKLGQKEWNLNVSSVNEAIYAINTNTDFKLRKILLDHQKSNIKYGVFVNRKNLQNNRKIKTSTLFLRHKNLKTIDIVPVVEGAFIGLLASVFGAGLLAFSGNALVANLAMILLFTGLSDMLSKPPEPPEMRRITNPSSDPVSLGESYLFSGPQNVINEGGPVPVGYGRLIVGSQVILAAYDVERILTEDAGRVV